MKLLKPAQNQTAYLKAGIQGFAGAGKTFTGTKIAIGLAKLVKGKSIAFFDSEKGSDFMVKMVADEGLEFYVHKGRAFVDLINVMKEAEAAGVSVLIIDSISHVWRELCDSYQKKTRRPRLSMNDWGILKGQWKEFVDFYINSKLHIIMLGRAGYEYDFEEGEDKRMEIRKTGTKMKVEGETGFEPDLLIEMERETDNRDGSIKNVAYIIKDRSDRLNGKRIENPKFSDFLPIINILNLGGDHVGVDTSRTSEDNFQDPDWSYEERKRRKEIALEEIKEAFILAELDGSSADAKKRRTEALIECFGTSAWTAIENMQLIPVMDGLQKLRAKLGQVPAAAEDDIPNFGAA